MYTRNFFLKDVAGCHTKYFKGESRGKGRQKSMPLKALVPPRPWGSFFFCLEPKVEKSHKKRYLGHILFLAKKKD